MKYFTIIGKTVVLAFVAMQDLGILQALTRLTRLCLDGIEISDDTLHSIAQCQRLQFLALRVDGTSITGLEHLTSLTALTFLSFQKFTLADEEAAYTSICFSLRNQVNLRH